MRFTPDEDQIIREYARTKTSKQIAKIIRTQLGIDRSHESIVDRRVRLVPDSQMEPIGYINLRDVDWYGLGNNRHVRNQIRQRAERERVTITYFSHGQKRKAVPLTWADAINAETELVKATWLTKSQLAKQMKITTRQFRDYRYRGPYPLLQSITTHRIGHTTYYHPEQSATAITEFNAVTERHKFLARNWWKTKRVANYLGVTVDSLIQGLGRKTTYRGVPVGVLKSAIGREYRRYFDPESVMEFKHRVLAAQSEGRDTAA